MPLPSNRPVLKVSQLNRMVRTLLEKEVGQVWLSGEISNFVAASSGHWYFTLKDSQAQIRGAMFKSANRRVLNRPKEGDKVLVRASISLYEPRGDYQLIVEHLEPEGQGALKQAFEALKVRLSAEGLFSPVHKQPLPATITRVGIITSQTGAALHDMLTVLKRRDPSVEVVIYPAQVQGQGATGQLVQALQLANARNEVEVLLLGRGGGSLEDLWCFNEEALARAVFASRLPVVSAVGHEVDVSICDYVADVRAPTPSAAAELVSQSREEKKRRLSQSLARFHQLMTQQIRRGQQHKALMEQQLKLIHPARQLQQQAQRRDQAEQRLFQAIHAQLLKASHQLERGQVSLARHSPEARLGAARQSLAFMSQRLNQRIQNQLERQAQRLGGASHLLDTLSPLATLGRGYSLTFKDEALVRSTKELAVGDTLTHTLKDGVIESRINAVTRHTEK